MDIITMYFFTASEQEARGWMGESDMSDEVSFDFRSKFKFCPRKDVMTDPTTTNPKHLPTPNIQSHLQEDKDIGVSQTAAVVESR